MDWKPMKEWKPKSGDNGAMQKFLFYYPAEAAKKYRTINLAEHYTVDSAPLTTRLATRFVVVEAPSS